MSEETSSILYVSRTEHHTITIPDDSPSPEAFLLQKYAPWWLWKGYFTLTGDYGAEHCIAYWHDRDSDNFFDWRYRADNSDPQDQSRRVDDPPSFPTLKPHIDLYGIPYRSRKQRGWYHIHRPPCVLCSTALSSAVRTPTLVPSSAAIRLPTEMIHQIARDSELRRTQAALVCRHWARVCLRQKWEAGLHGREHVMKLRSLVTAPVGSYLQKTIWTFQEMKYCFGQNDDPWLHLLPSTRKMMSLCSSGTDEVRITGPLHKGLLTMRSIHAYLPRRMPSSFCSTVEQLTLCKIHFRRISDLAHTLEELSRLKRFVGEQLTWMDSDTLLAPLRLWTHSGLSTFVLPTAELSSCTRNLEAISLVRASHYECVYLHAVLQSLAQNNPPIVVRSMHKNLEGFSASQYRITIISSPYGVASELRVIQTWQADFPMPLRVKLNMRISIDTPLDMLDSVDWGACDNAIMEYTQVQTIIIGLYDTSGDFEDAEWISMGDCDILFLTNNLPLSHAAGKLSFLRPIPGQWDVKTEEEKEDEDEDEEQKREGDATM